MQIFARITKVDEATGKVYGRAVQEVVDRSGEIFDYATSKPNFEKWSTDIAKATDGKSVGNVRAMHGKVAAGKLTAITFNDAEKAIDVVAEIVDPVEREKALKGVYTGFSIGGRYVRKWEDDVHKGVERYTAEPSEISIVDLPCVPTAQFTVVKSDGSEELRKFSPDADRIAKARSDMAARIHKNAAAAEPVANALFALLGKPMEKGMCSVGQLADLLSQLGWIADDAEWEATFEGDGSTVPADLREAVKNLAAILVRMAVEESQEMAESLGAGTEKIADGDLSKSEEDAMNAELQKAHDEAKAELAKVVAERDEKAEALTKAVDDLAKSQEALEKATAERDALTKAVEERDALLVKAAEAIDERNAVIKKLEAMPEPIKAAMRAVSKGDDLANGDNSKSIEPVRKADGTVDEAATEIRKALMNPVIVR